MMMTFLLRAARASVRADEMGYRLIADFAPQPGVRTI